MKSAKNLLCLFLSVLLLINVLSANVFTAFAAETTKKSTSAGDFLTDDMIDTFLEMFYSNEATTAEEVRKVLTGEELGTKEIVSNIFENSFNFFLSLDIDDLDKLTDEATAYHMNQTFSAGRLVMGVVNVYKNYQSFTESDSAAQKTVAGFQIFGDIVTAVGYGKYLPAGYSAIMSIAEITMCLAGYLECAYFKENADFYKAELEIAYWTDEELPYKEAPSVSGFGITQKEADSIYIQLYLSYVVKRIGKNVGSGSSQPETTAPVEVTNVKFDKTKFTLFSNQTVTIPVTVYPSDATVGTELEFYSDNPSVLSVNYSTGQITALAPGTACAMVFSSNGIVNNCEITVLPYNVEEVSGGYSITAYTGSSEIIEIPGVVEGVPVVDIKNQAFYNNDLITDVVISDTVTNIGTMAFGACDNLKRVYISDSVTSIGTAVFELNPNLTDVTLGSGLTALPYKTFNECSSLKNVSMGSNIKTIGNYAFYGCKNLESITLPNGLTTIEWGAFELCNLAEVSLPATVSAMDISAFDSDTVINVDSNNSVYCSLDGALLDKQLTTLYRYPKTNTIGYTLPETVTKISTFAFSGCSESMSITIPESVKTIEARAFQNCTGLKEITINSKVAEFADDMFSGCTNLRKVTISNGVTSLGRRVFSGCTNLASVTLPETITSIGVRAFNECTSLANIKIPENVTTISGSAFLNCSGLVSIEIPDGVKSIEKSVFYGCTGLKNVIIPESVTSIGNSSFYKCTNLESIKLPKNLSTIDKWAFESTGLKSIKIPSTVTTIGTEAFLSVPDDFVMYGYCDSAAQTYASSNSLKFGGFGDANNDGALSISDATAVQKQLAKVSAIENKDIVATDVNGDGKLTIRDVTYIQMYIAKMIEDFPITA